MASHIFERFKFYQDCDKMLRCNNGGYSAKLLIAKVA